MHSFVAGALQLLELSQSEGMEDCDSGEVRILVGGDCGTLIIMNSAEEWTLDALRQHCGAGFAYRVVREHGVTKVDGVSPRQTCSVRSGSPVEAWRQLIRPGSYVCQRVEVL